MPANHIAINEQLVVQFKRPTLYSLINYCVLIIKTYFRSDFSISQTIKIIKIIDSCRLSHDYGSGIGFPLALKNYLLHGVFK